MNNAPLLVGFLALLVLSATLVVREPAPGALAASHAEIGTTLATCATCHTPQGLDAGCLACHDEIAKQIESGHGFHAERRSDCAGCHPDHHGESFDMLEAIAWRPGERESYSHDHVSFALTDSHDGLACRRCHRTGRTYLDLAQDCASCHDDVHGGALFRDCAKCHDQKQFKPASRFDHSLSFPLLGRHAEAACDRCHGGLEYREVKGKECQACHDSPHRFESPNGCEECHHAEDAGWIVAQAEFRAPRHAETGFELVSAHVKVACAECHKPALPYDARFPVPPRAADDCLTCHEDVHRGQFAAACTTCHDQTHFVPARYDLERHTEFALRGAHAKTECRGCHTEIEGTRRFVGTPKTCAACHQDPHAGQFKESCDQCHDDKAFTPARYPLERHKQFALSGAHARTECRACHTEVEGSRRFVGTPRTCAACHQDPHAGQFKESCDQCHDDRAFTPARYPLERHKQFALTGAHGAVACNSCHTVEKGTRRFEGTPRKCATCHENPHGTQFRRELKSGGCAACHDTASFRLRRFDHDKRTSYKLEGEHAKADCARCHRPVGKPPVRRYRDTPRTCATCHGDEHRGQFADRRCDRCHTGFREWEIRRFDHTRTRFPLDGTHRRISCDDCHPKVRQRDGREVVQYRPIRHRCKDCHEVERR